MNAKTIRITIRSKFHATSCNVRVDPDGQDLSDATARRVDNALCGMDDCNCGGINWAEAEGGYHIEHRHSNRYPTPLNNNVYFIVPD